MLFTETEKLNSVEQSTANFSGLRKKTKAIVYLQIIHGPMSSIDTFTKIYLLRY